MLPLTPPATVEVDYDDKDRTLLTARAPRPATSATSPRSDEAASDFLGFVSFTNLSSKDRCGILISIRSDLIHKLAIVAMYQDSRWASSLRSLSQPRTTSF